MANPVIQVKRGLLANLPGLLAGEPGFTTDSYDLYVGLTSETATNKIVGSGRFWTNSTSSTGSGVNLVEGTSNGTSFITLKAPDSLAGIVTYTMPGTDGSSGHILKTDGNGNLSFSAPAASSFTLAADTGSNDTFNTGETLTFEGGEGVDTTVSNNKITIAAEIASTTNAGVASFASADFSVTAGGLVSIQEERVQDIVGAMVSSNTESGISVVYQDADGTLDFDVADFTLTLGGDLTGSATVTNLGNATLNATIAANSVALGNDTTGNYVATISGTANEIEVTGSGSETASVTIGLPNNVSIAGTLTVDRIDANQISPDGSDFGTTDYVPVANGSGGWSWQPVTSAGAGTLDGITVSNTNGTVGTAGSITNIKFTDNLVVTGTAGGNIATVSVSSTPTFTSVVFGSGTAITSVDTDLSSVSASDDTLASAKSIKAYVDAQDANIASDTLTFTNKTFNANGTGNSISNLEVADFAASAIVTEAEGLNSSDNDTSLPTTAAVKNYVDSVDLTITTAEGTNGTGGGGGSVATSQTMTFAGTTNEIDVTVAGQSITYGLPNDVTIGNNLTVSGNLYVNGSTTQVNTSSMTVEDRTIELGIVNGSAPSATTTWDLGVLFNYYQTSAKKSAVVWEQGDSRFKFASEVSDGGGTNNNSPQITFTAFAPIEIGSLWVTDCAGTSQVISCTGTTRNLENITIDAGTF
jgi:hypothetical protein